MNFSILSSRKFEKAGQAIEAPMNTSGRITDIVQPEADIVDNYRTAEMRKAEIVDVSRAVESQHGLEARNRELETQNLEASLTAEASENRVLEIEENLSENAAAYEKEREAADRLTRGLLERLRALEATVNTRTALARYSGGGTAPAPNSPHNFGNESVIDGNTKVDFDTTRGLSLSDLNITTSISTKELERGMAANPLSSSRKSRRCSSWPQNVGFDCT